MPKKGLAGFEEVRQKIGKIAENVEGQLAEKVDDAIQRQKAPEEVMHKNVASLGFRLWEIVLPYAIKQAELYADPKKRGSKECEINSVAMFTSLPKLARDVVTVFASLIEVKEKEKREMETAEAIAYIRERLDETPTKTRQKRITEVDKLLDGSDENPN